MGNKHLTLWHIVRIFVLMFITPNYYMKSIVLFVSLSLISCKSPEIKVHELQGKWALSKYDNVSFSVENDSIYYPEYERKYNIKLSKNNLEVFEEGHSVNNFNVVKTSKDSLFLQLQNGKVEGYTKITD